MKFIFLMILFWSASSFSKDKRKIDLSWDEIPEAKSYEVELFQSRPDGEVSLGVFPSPGAIWSRDVEPGKYRARLRAMDYRGVPGDWSELIDIRVKLSSVQGLKPFSNESVSESEVHFQWTKIEGALSYQFFLKDLKNEDITTEVTIEPELKWDVQELGNYEWAVVALGEGDESQEAKKIPNESWRKFIRVGGELNSPVVRILVDKNVVVSWPEVTSATSYELIFIPPPKTNFKSWRKTIYDSTFFMNLEDLPQGSSTLTVQAKGANYKDSKKTLVKILREKEKVLTTITGAESPDLVGWGDQFHRHWIQIEGMYGNGLYSATNVEKDTKVDRTALGAMGLQLDYRFAQHREAFRQNYLFEFYNYSSGASAQSWSASYTLGKAYKKQGREWGLGGGAGLKQWPLLIPDRTTSTIEVDNALFFTPKLALWWQDTLSERQTVRMDANIDYNYSIGKKIEGFISTNIRGHWLYFFKPNQAFVAGLSLQAMKTNYTNNGNKDKQELGLIGLNIGWAGGF